MLVHPTIERLHALGLSAMADAFVELQNTRDAAELSREDWLGLLLDREVTHRENRKLTRRLRAARLRQAAVVEDVDFRAPRGLDRGLFRSLPPAIGSATTSTWRWSGRPASARAGLPVRSAIRPAARASPSSTSARHACSPTSPRRAAKDDCRG
jgi:hypothetical protein